MCYCLDDLGEHCAECKKPVCKGHVPYDAMSIIFPKCWNYRLEQVRGCEEIGWGEKVGVARGCSLVAMEQYVDLHVMADA